ncbi:hypothetical protein YN1HA_6160 [Sulfurisphaera ohwakuensis]
MNIRTITTSNYWRSIRVSYTKRVLFTLIERDKGVTTFC